MSTFTEDFLKKKASSGGATGSTGGTATQSFLEERKKKREQEAKQITEKPVEATAELSPTETKVGDSSVDLQDITKDPIIFTRPVQESQPGTAYMGQGTLSTGQGVKINQAPITKPKKDPEELRIKTADLVMGAEQMGKMYIDTLGEEDKNLLIEGLKNKAVNRDIDYMKREKAQQILDNQFPETRPVLKAKDHNEVTYTPEEIIANKDTGKIPFLTAMTPDKREAYVAEMQAAGRTLDPYNPKDWAQFEKLRKNFDTEYEGKKILAEKKTMADDPLENIDAALNIGKYGVFSTMGALQEWAGGMIGSKSMQDSGEAFRKESDSRAEWESVRFNQEMDANDSNILDSRFWTQKVPTSVPFMVALVPAGIAGASAGTATAGALGLGTIGTYLTTAGFAGLTSRFAEGLAEGADTYATLKDKGISEQKASERAWKTTAANMALMFSDMTQLAITFAPVSKLLPGGGRIKNMVVGGGKFAFDAASEGGEEVFQGYVQNYNVSIGEGKEPVSVYEYLNSDEARQVFVLGATTGLALGGLGVAKDAYDNFSRRVEAQVESVETAIEKNDIDYIGKMEVLANKEMITRDTLDAVKTLMNIKTQEQVGMSYEQWYTQGIQERSKKIAEAAKKTQDIETNTRKARESTKVESLKFESVGDIADNFQRQTGETVKEAMKKIQAIEDSNIDIEIPYSKEQLSAIKTIEKVREKSGKFLYTPIKATELEAVKKSGIAPKEGKIILGENPDIAKVVDQGADVMIRVNEKQKLDNFSVAQTESGENLFQTDTPIAPENIEVNTGKGWEKLKKTESSTGYEIGDTVRYKNARGEEKIGTVSENKYKEKVIVDDGGVQYGEKHFGEKIEKNNKIKITESQKERVKKDLEDTKRLLEKEKKYSEDLQKKDVIDRYEKHIKKLEKIIEEGEYTPTINEEEVKDTSTPEKPDNGKQEEKPVEKTQKTENIVKFDEERMKDNKSDEIMEYSKGIDEKVDKKVGEYTIKSKVWYTMDNGYMVKAEKEGKTRTVNVKDIYASENMAKTQQLETSNPEKPDNGKQEEKPVEKTQKTEIKDISEKAIAVVGDTMEIKEKLKEIGGKWNPKYKGWIFSKKRRAEVEKVLSTNNSEYDNTKQVGSAEDSGSKKDTDTEMTRGGGDTSGEESRNGLGGEGATSTRKVGKKGRAEINEKAKEILEKREYSTDAIEYTQEELQVLRDYSGAGGKESTGAEGRGLLDEYYTPRKVVDAMWKMVEAVNPRAKTVLEPTVGVGRFIEGKSEKYDISAMEIDKVSGTIAQILNQDAKIKIGDFQNNFIDDKGKKSMPKERYDIIIGNPPYGARSGFLKGLGEESKIGRQEEYFIKRGIDLLEDGGVLSFIIPSSFLQNGKSFAKERIVSAGGELVAAYRLPEGVFEDTTIGTDIIVVRKTGNGNLEQFIDDGYFAENPQNIIGDVKERKNRYGRQEEYVYAEDKERVLDRLGNLAENMKKYEEDIARMRTEEKQTVSKKETTEKVQREKPTQTKKKESKVQDVSGIRTVEYQVLNDWNVTPEELEIFRVQDKDGSVPYKEEWKEYLNYFSGKWYHDINYFSGNVREKLEVLGGDHQHISKEQYKKQEEGLLKVMPEDKTVQDINFDPLDRSILEMETTGTLNGWDSKKREYFTKNKTILDEFGEYVRDIPRGVIGHNVERGDIMRYVGGERARADTKKIAGYIKSESKRFFNEFIKTRLDYETQQKIAEKFNREKNAYVRPKYDRIPVEVRGMAEEFRGKKFMLSETQKTGVGFLVNKGSGLIAYGVGVGKTHTLTVATKANMDKGWTKRPLFIVPGSTLEKTWIQTIQQVFPGVKINNLGGLQAPIVRQLKAERGEDVSKWINDGEISVITHDGILKLGFDVEEMYELTKDLTDALGSFDAGMTIREMEKNKQKIQEELGKAMKGAGEIGFTQLGFDHISVDEVHNFRKVFQGAKIETDKDGEKKANRRFSNVSGGTPSTRARKLFLLSQAVQKANGGRNVFLASATPFENHATEVYNILSFMARDRLKQMGIFNINDFFTSFANFQTDIVQKVDGSFDNKDIMKSFSNLPELQKLLQEFIDYQEDMTLVRPDKIVLTPQLPMSEKQDEVKQKILEMLAGEDDGVILKATTYAKSNSVSPFFVSEFMDSPKNVEEFIEQSPKIKYTMEMIAELKGNTKTKDKGSFIYIGKEGVGFTDYYVKYLTEKIGYKKEQIGVIVGDVSIDAREEIKNKFNSGEIKVLIGGDPTKEGIDLQENGYATFNIALGWNPTEMAQVEGRVWRQGNKASKVLMVYPLVENSGDVNIYQKFEEKAGRINDLFSYNEGASIFDVGELDPKEKKLMLLTDPSQKANLSIKIDSERLQSELSYTRGQKEDMKKMKEDYNAAEQQVKYMKERGEFADDERKKELRKDIDKYRVKMKGIEKKLEEKQIESFDKEIARLEQKEQDLEKKVEDIKLQYQPLVDRFQREQEESIARTKTIEQHKEDIRKNTESLRIKTDEELQAEKQQKVEKQAMETAEQRKYQTENNWIYDIIAEKYQTEPFYKGKVRIEEAYQEAIRLAPSGWKVETHFPTTDNFLIDENGNENIAYADLEKKIIVINSNEARKSTAAHEVVHAALSELDEKRRNEILNLSKAQWEKETSTSLSKDEAEEFLAEEFKYYIENQKYKTRTIVGRLREFLSKLWNTIKGVFGKDNKIKTFYEDVLSGKIKSSQTNTGKKFQSAYDEKTQRMYDAIDDENWGTNYSKIAKYKVKSELKDKKKKKSKGWESFKEWSEDMLVPLDEILGNINKKLRDRLVEFEYQIMNDPEKRAAKPILKELFDKLKSKKNTEEYQILDMAMKNSDMPVVEEMAKKLGVYDEIMQMREVLEKMYQKAKDVGVDIGYIKDYFPRVVEDKKGLMEYIYKTDEGAGIMKALKDIEERKGHELTDEEKIVAVNKLIRGFEVEGITLSRPGNMEKRNIEEVTSDLDPYYHDSMDALLIYMNAMSEDIAARRLFGKGESLHNSIGAWTLKLVADGTIKPVDEITITRVLKARFADNAMGAWVQSYRSLAYLTTMGSPISAISQIQDLAFSFFENGIFRSLGEAGKAVIGKSIITPEDLGIDSVMHEISDNGRLQKWVSKTFQLVGLSYMDRITKQTMINGAYMNMKKDALAGKLEELDVFEDQGVINQVIEDFKNDVVSEDIKYLLFAKLCEYQPLTRSQMPPAYNTMKNGRIVYMLKTYLVKQLSVFREKSIKEMKQGVMERNSRKVIGGAVKFLHLAILLMLMGMTADALKNIILNRPFTLDDMVIDNILKLAGFSKYTVYQVREKTLSEGILSIVTPPFNFFNDVIQDIYDEKREDITKAQSINNIPIAGKLFYWWFGKGKDKSDKKRDSGGSTSTTKSTTKKTNPFSSSSAFKSTSGFSNTNAWK